MPKPLAGGQSLLWRGTRMADWLCHHTMPHSSSARRLIEPRGEMTASLTNAGHTRSHPSDLSSGVVAHSHKATGW